MQVHTETGNLRWWKELVSKCSKLNIHADLPVTGSSSRINKKRIHTSHIYAPPISFQPKVFVSDNYHYAEVILSD